MKRQHWAMIAAAGALSGPVCVWAQAVHSGPTLPVPHALAHQPDGAGTFVPDFMPDIDPAPPNRRVPSLAPPKPGNVHPITPDEAWPKPPAIKPARPAGNRGTGLLNPTQPLGEPDR